MTTETRTGPSRQPTLSATAVASLAALFAADLLSPPSVAVAILYAPVVVAAQWRPWLGSPRLMAAVAAALVSADAAAAWGRAPAGLVLANAVLALAALGAAAAAAARAARVERGSLASLEQLGDFKRALDHAAIVATTDVSGRITYVNDKFCEISGYTRAELLGQDHRIINSAHHPKTFIRDIWRTIAGGRVWHGEIRNRAKDGHFYWVDTTIVPFLNAAGKPYQYIAIRADITARKLAEERLAQQAALARVGEMAAVVAHEVRNPLAGVKGAMQILMSRRPAGDADVPVMRDIVARIDSLSELINDLMLFARPRPPRLAAVGLRGLLDEAAAMMRRDPAAAATDIVVGGDDVRLRGDAEMLRATLLNLLLNAVQAMNGHGRITLDAVRQGDRVVVTVADTGPGVPEEFRERVFDPFFTTKARGGGLGLAIARRTAELHDGTLTLACPPAGGTVLTMILPLEPVAAGAPAAASPPLRTGE